MVLHPWLQDTLTHILAALPEVTLADAERPNLARWETWLGHPPRAPLPPLRLILIWDNLAGHLSYAIVRRALAGHHPQTPEEIIAWLEDTVAG